MTTVQLVSKPVAPPWNDATNVVVRGILVHGSMCRYRFFGTPASRVLEGPHVLCDVVAGAHRFQPSFGDHVRTLTALLRSSRATGVYHCLFTPNPRTSMVLKAVLRARGRPIVHTLCSSPQDWAGIARLLFADRLVTVSAWARRCLEQQGVGNVEHIPPGIAVPTPSGAITAGLRRQHRLPADGPCLVFSGDYEYSAAHPVILAALPEIVRHHPGAVVVFACRTKTQEAIGIEAEVRRQVEAAGLAPHVRLLREVDDFESLLALADVVLFPVQSLYRKMDIPVTLLQALALHRPIVASTLGPLQELLAKPVGLGVPPGDAVALAAAVCTLLGHPGRRASMGAAGHALVVEQYSAARMAASYERLYLSLARHQ